MALGPGPCRSGLIVLPGPCLPRRCQMRWCILGRVQAGKRPGEGVFVAVDVHYLPSGAARAAAVMAADATFSCLLADRTGQVAEVPPYQSEIGRAHV